MYNNIKDIIIIILCFIICFIFYENSSNDDIKFNYVIKDSIEYNIIKKDSIEYNIIKKDSIIIELKKQLKYEKDSIINMSDSAIINKFTKLANE